MSEGRRERVKSRIRSEGIENFEEHEILELMLFPFLPRKDTHALAREVIARFVTLERVLNAKEEELLQVPGMPKDAALYIPTYSRIVAKAKKQGLSRTRKAILPVAAAEFYKEAIGNLLIEEFHIMFLDSKRRYIKDERIAIGNETKAVVDFKRIVEKVLFMHANYIILSHNHPSGESFPSQEDIIITKQIADILAPLEIVVMDHIIVTKDGHYSMWENQCLQLTEKGKAFMIAEPQLTFTSNNPQK